MLILDGAMGTMIQRASLQEADYRGERFTALPIAQQGNNDLLSLSRAQLIKDIHAAYLEAGAHIISTNTFNANRISMEDYGLCGLVEEMNVAAARLAREVCDDFMRRYPERKCYVAGSMGPTNKSASMSPKVEDPGFRAVSFAQLLEAYREQAAGLLEGGVDILLIETAFDTLNVKAALFAIQEELTKRGLFGTFPVMLSATVADASGRTLSGQSLEAFVCSVAHFPLWSIGLNCSFGAEQMAPFVQLLSKIAPCKVSAHPNAGLPDLYGKYNETPEQMVQKVRPYIEGGWVDIIGGCCGTSPEHIRAIATMVDGRTNGRVEKLTDGWDRRANASVQQAVPRFSGLDVLELREPIRFVLVGERTNVAGSKKFARLIREEKYEEALELAREMLQAGAHVIDINMDDPMLDAPAAMQRFLQLLAAEPDIARLPLMLDSSRWEVLEAGLACVQGKSLVNSISLKEGEEVFKYRALKIKQYGAAAVVMAFDEEGQANTLARRIEICSRAYKILTQELGYDPQSIIFDPNVLTIGTGMEEHRNFAVDFIETVRFIKQELPGTLVSGGVSNLSFAFRGNNTVREAMHSVFLYHAMRAGLDMAIVNPSTMMPYEEISGDLRKAVEDVVLNSDAEATARLVALASVTEQAVAQGGAMPKNEWRGEAAFTRLGQALVLGETRYLEEDIQEALQKGHCPISIIEDALMSGMNRVGKLFGEGKMFLPQVVKSARVMKQAVLLLQPLLDAGNDSGSANRPTGIIATVKGDVHDIGKNIAAVVMECNHYKLIDLGVMVPAGEIVRAAIEHKADFVGLSGLITPSLEEMCAVAEAMEAAGLSIPLLIGGATTSKEYTALRMASKYSGLLLHCPDASTNVGYLSRWFSPQQRAGLQEEIQIEYSALRLAKEDGAAENAANILSLEEARKNKFRNTLETDALAVPTFAGRRTSSLSSALLRPLINWNALYALWKVHPSETRAQASSTQHAGGCSCGCEDGPNMQTVRDRLKRDAEALLDQFDAGIWGKIQAVIGIYPACSNGAEAVKVFEKEHAQAPVLTFDFPRQLQKKPEGQANLCLADFVAPESEPVRDHIGLFAINASPKGVEEQIAQWTAQGDSYRSLLLRSLCDRLAEAASEYLHRSMQTGWLGYGEGKGIRPAFGYPACPDHRPKTAVLELLKAGEINLSITEGYMLQPVSAICGLYFAHPESRYFKLV